MSHRFQPYAYQEGSVAMSDRQSSVVTTAVVVDDGDRELDGAAHPEAVVDGIVADAEYQHREPFHAYGRPSPSISPPPPDLINEPGHRYDSPAEIGLDHGAQIVEDPNHVHVSADDDKQDPTRPKVPVILCIVLVIALIAGGIYGLVSVLTNGDDNGEMNVRRGDGYSVVWQDTFDRADGSPPNTKDWGYEIGFIRNNEMQYYTDSTDNAFIKGGVLQIQALSTPYKAPDGRSAAFTSASIYSKTAYKYGRFEARIRVSAGTGVWPAFWLIGEDADVVGWPRIGEIDIFEYFGYDSKRANAAVQTDARNFLRENDPKNAITVSDINSEFHNYNVDWTPTSITIFVDNSPVLSITSDNRCRSDSWPFNKPFRFKLNLAIGGTQGGKYGIDDSIFPALLEVDSVTVSQQLQNRPQEPKCDLVRYFATFITSQSTTSLSLVSSQFMIQPDRVEKFRAEFKRAMTKLIGLPASDTDSVEVDQIRPLVVAGENVRILVNFTVLNVATSKVAAQLQDTSLTAATFSAARLLLSSFIEASSSTTPLLWSVDRAVSDTCPFVQCDQSLPFEQYTVPVRVPFVNFDYGGEGRGYHDTTSWNRNFVSEHRSGLEAVDISRPQRVVPSDFTYDVGYCETGEWLRFSQIMTGGCPNDVQAAQSFTVSVRASNGGIVPGRIQADFISLHPSCPGTTIAIETAVTGNWNLGIDSDEVPVRLTCGCMYALQWSFPLPSYSLESFTILAEGGELTTTTAPPTTTSAAPPSNGTGTLE